MLQKTDSGAESASAGSATAPAASATSDIDYRLLVPVLVNSLLIHAVVAIIRVTTSYRAVELDLPIIWLGVISATYAIFPIFLAVWVGRFIDRGHDAVTAWIGSGLIALASAGLAFFSSAAPLLVATAILGTDAEPQPDAYLYILPACSGQCTANDDGYLVGAPEWVGEISDSTDHIPNTKPPNTSSGTIS